DTEAPGGTGFGGSGGTFVPPPSRFLLLSGRRLRRLPLYRNGVARRRFWLRCRGREIRLRALADPRGKTPGQIFLRGARPAPRRLIKARARNFFSFLCFRSAWRDPCSAKRNKAWQAEIATAHAAPLPA